MHVGVLMSYHIIWVITYASNASHVKEHSFDQPGSTVNSSSFLSLSFNRSMLHALSGILIALISPTFPYEEQFRRYSWEQSISCIGYTNNIDVNKKEKRKNVKNLDACRWISVSTHFCPISKPFSMRGAVSKNSKAQSITISWTKWWKKKMERAK